MAKSTKMKTEVKNKRSKNPLITVSFRKTIIDKQSKLIVFYEPTMVILSSANLTSLSTPIDLLFSALRYLDPMLLIFSAFWERVMYRKPSRYLCARCINYVIHRRNSIGTRKHAYIILTPIKPHFYIVKLGFTEVYIIFLISAQNIDCGYSLEPPHRGGSNDYPQSMF